MNTIKNTPIRYDFFDGWRSLALLYDSALKEVNTKLEILNNEFKFKNQHNPIEHIISRMKTPESIVKKLKHNNREVNLENIEKYVNDVAGVRIICSFASDINKIAALISKQTGIKVLKIKDYINNPKPNGYRSYHMIVTVAVFLSNRVMDVKVEIQIRTIAMDFWASLEHKIYYKFDGNAPAGIRDELKACADVIDFLDNKMRTLNETVVSYREEQEELNVVEEINLEKDEPKSES